MFWKIKKMLVSSTNIKKYRAKKIKERQAQGIEIAKKKGKFKGRQHKFKENDPRLKHAFDLFLNGLSDKEVEEQTGINRRTFRRYRARYNVTVDQ
ncbi:TPA: recombinase family protein, partial [Enterococcus faecium]|nr:recombinase family protein [Enterococcus faecium]HCI0451664.1 recombinase family protein [Enterococcus faecium]HCI0481615.1 recombinase family protein [Enterococcus faecium]HCI0779480.1 recombinase family protein [Enterococcus faecium]HCI1007062.1 recombinase family protein [Enterococcus faecium]